MSINTSFTGNLSFNVALNLCFQTPVKMISVFCRRALVSPTVMLNLRPNTALIEAATLLRQTCCARSRTFWLLSKLRTAAARFKLERLVRSAFKSPASRFVFCSALGYHKDGLRHVLYHPPNPQSSPVADLAEELRLLSLRNQIVQILWQIFGVIKILFRTLEMCFIIAPLVITAPLALKFEGFQDRWFRLLVATIEKCGPVYVKLGQWASTR